MKEVKIYKDTCEEIIIKAIVESRIYYSETNIPDTFTEQEDIKTALATIPCVNVGEEKYMIVKTIAKYYDGIPFDFSKESNLLGAISIRLAAWLYPLFQEAGYGKKESTRQTVESARYYLTTFSFEEWQKMFDTAKERNFDWVNYLYVRDNLQEPTLTKDEVKDKIKTILLSCNIKCTPDELNEYFSNGYEIEITLSDISNSLYENLYEKISEWLWLKVVAENPQFSTNEKYQDALVDFGSDCINDATSDIFDESTYVTIEEWQDMILSIIKNK